MTNSEKHHFLPKFYLRSWNEEKKDNFYAYYRNALGKIEFRNRSAKTIGYVEDLYAIQPDGMISNERSNDIERQFFGKIDNDAAIAHKKIILQGSNKISKETKKIWSLFVSSLLERTPERIDQIANLSRDEAAKEIEKIISENRSNEFEKKAREIISKTDMKMLIANSVLLSMKKRIEDNEVTNEIQSLKWSIFELKKGQDHFLTSDKPLVINSGLEAPPIHSISMALSPHKILSMTRPSPRFDDNYLAITAHTHNAFMCKQAKKYLISSRPLGKTNFFDYTAAAEKLMSREHGT